MNHTTDLTERDRGYRITLGVAAGLPVLIIALAMPLLVDGVLIGFGFAPLVILVVVVAVFLGKWMSLALVVVASAGIGVWAGSTQLPAVTVTGLGFLLLIFAWLSWVLAQGRWPALAAIPGCLLLVGALVAGLAGSTEGTVLAAFVGAAIVMLLTVSGPWGRSSDQRSPARVNMVTVAALVGIPVVIAVVSTQLAGGLGVPLSISLFAIDENEEVIAGEPPDPFYSAVRWQLDPNEQDRLLLSVSVSPDGPSGPPIWASFPSFNGFSWTNAPGITVPGDALGVDGVPVDAAAESTTTNASIVVGLSLPGQWVPAPQRVTQVLGTAATRVDEFTGTVTSASSPVDQTFVITYDMTVANQETVNSTQPQVVNDIDPAVLLPGGLPQQLTDIGDQVINAAGNSTWQKLVALSRYFRSDSFAPAGPSVLAAGVPNRTYEGLAEVVATGLGVQEQYAALWALIARSWGVPTRLVIGWAPNAPGGSTELGLRGRDTNVWAQARLTDLGWVTFQPSPQDRDAGRPAVVRPLRPADVPAPAPTPSPTPAPNPDGSSDSGSDAGDQSSLTTSPNYLVLALLAAVVGLAVWIAAVALIRRRRARKIWLGNSRQIAQQATSYVRVLCAEAGYELPATWAPAAIPVVLEQIPGNLSEVLDRWSVEIAPMQFGPNAAESDATIDAARSLLRDLDRALIVLNPWWLRMRRVLLPPSQTKAGSARSVTVKESHDAVGGVDRFVMK